MNKDTHGATGQEWYGFDFDGTLAKELHKVQVKHRKAHIFPDLERRRLSA